MRRLTTPPQTKSARELAPGLRAAFTLVELLIVISIILTLMALIAPALQSVFSKAKEAQVRAEIVGLSNACEDFKSTYGHYPPSYIVLCERPADWSSHPESMKTLRRIFGREFDFSIARNFNPAQDSDMTDTHTLKGAECLVFFLGGIAEKDGAGNWKLTGFSKSKYDPFKTGGTNRNQYFTEWKINRLGDADNDGLPEYYDEFNQGGLSPYVYASAMRTGKYEPSDLNATVSMTKVYLQSETSATDFTPWKDKAFQIISPGRDGKYGTGGLFTEDDGVGARFDEYDNLTNFSQSRLGR